jgi:hypothetical protein
MRIDKNSAGKINKSNKINKKQKSSEMIKLITLSMVVACVICPQGSIYMNSFTASMRIKRIENYESHCSLFFTTYDNEEMIRSL